MFKVVGGKRKIASSILEFIPELEGRRYYEPFMGGAAIYRALRARGDNATSWNLSDACAHTVRAMHAIQSDPDGLQAEVDRLFEEYNALPCLEDQSKCYYTRRNQYNADPTPAVHIFLRQCCFNGLWRVSKKGHFNTPWGKRAHVPAPSVHGWYDDLKDARIRNASFDDVFPEIHSGDVVYCDPPYWQEFSEYTKEGFSDGDHLKLFNACREAEDRGAHVVMSNVGTARFAEVLRAHWPTAKVHSFPSSQTIAARAAKRKGILEYVYVGGQP